MCSWCLNPLYAARGSVTSALAQVMLTLLVFGRFGLATDARERAIQKLNVLGSGFRLLVVGGGRKVSLVCLGTEAWVGVMGTVHGDVVAGQPLILC